MKPDRRQILLGGAGLVLSNASGLAADYTNYDALGLAELIARKQITALELLHAVRSRVEALNPKINAFCHLFFDRAEAQIREGLPGGPFRGVPYALKDLGQFMKGTVTSMGSRVWKNSVADADSTYVTRCKLSFGAVCGLTATLFLSAKRARHTTVAASGQ